MEIEKKTVSQRRWLYYGSKRCARKICYLQRRHLKFFLQSKHHQLMTVFINVFRVSPTGAYSSILFSIISSGLISDSSKKSVSSRLILSLHYSSYRERLTKNDVKDHLKELKVMKENLWSMRKRKKNCR